MQSAAPVRIGAALLIFLLNDLIFIALPAGSAGRFFLVDHGCRIAVLILIWPCCRRVTRPAVLDALLLAICAIVIGRLIGNREVLWLPLFEYARPDAPPLLFLDLTLGLVLVAASEELLFRSAMLSALRGTGQIAAVGVSSSLFGAIHWGLGGASVLAAALTGIVFAAYALRGNRIGTLIAAHWIANVVLIY